MSINIAAIVIAGLAAAVFAPEPSSTNLDMSRLRGAPSWTAHITPGGLPAGAVSTIAQPSSPEDFGVFGSVAISAARLPAAAKWQAARQTDYAAFFTASCATAGFEWCDSSFASTARDVAEKAGGLDERDMLDLVNRTINGAMTYQDDAQLWGMGDYWATPVEMAEMGAGDCEDYAIAKYWLLRSMGVADADLQMVILQDTRRQLFHAVLVAHMPSGSYVLDNVSNRLLTDAAYGQYQPIMSFAGTKNFIHGFADAGRDVAAMPANLSSIAPGVGL